MRKRTSYLLLAILGLSLAACGCQGQPAAATSANGAASPATDETEVADNEPATSPMPPDLGPQDDPHSPLQFQLTEEELARQAGSGGGGFDPSDLAGAVPESITTGPVGSLGSALFKGFVGAAGSDGEGESSDGGETP